MPSSAGEPSDSLSSRFAALFTDEEQLLCLNLYEAGVSRATMLKYLTIENDESQRAAQYTPTAEAMAQQGLPTCRCGRSIAFDGSESCCGQCPRGHTGCCRRREARRRRREAGTSNSAPCSWCSCGRTVSQTARFRHVTCCLQCPNAHTDYCERREQQRQAARPRASSATTVATVGGANASRGASTADA